MTNPPLHTRILALITPRRVLLALLLLILAAAGLWLLRTTGAAFSPAAIREALVPLGGWGPVALIVLLACVLVVPVIPATVLQIGAGLAFGPPLGLLYVLLADVLGASAGFWLARRWGHSVLDKRLSPATQATLERLTKRMTWRGVLLLRLLPGPAYPLVSLAAGYSPLTFVPYTLASFAGVLPSLALLVLAGDLVTTSPLLAFGLVVLLVAGLALAGRLLKLGES